MKVTGDMIVFITGGARGLGEATLRMLHEEGAKVAIADLNEERMVALKEELGERMLWFNCDVTKEEQVNYAMDSTVKEWGTIHVVVPCAGICPKFAVGGDKSETDFFKKTIEINLYGTLHVVQRAAQIMKENKPVNERGEKGVMVLVSSILKEEGGQGDFAYSASKGAIASMVLPMARDLGKHNIRVVATAPGPFDTPMLADFFEATKKNGTYEKIINLMTPMGRTGFVDEFAHFVKAIIENGYLNGQALRIDGATKLVNAD